MRNVIVFNFRLAAIIVIALAAVSDLIVLGSTPTALEAASAGGGSSGAGASLVLITEIMYDPPGADAGHEWIEIENAGQATVDLSSWRLFEANTNHKIAPRDGGTAGSTTDGTAEVASGGFAIISSDPDKFIADHPGFSGIAVKSSFSLSNAGEKLAIRDDALSDIDSVSYDSSQGATGDGNSLQRASDGAWISAPPTPGGPTVATSSVSPAESATATATALSSENSTVAATSSVGVSKQISVHDRQELANTSPDAVGMRTSIGRPRLGFVDSSLPFEVKIVSGLDSSMADRVQTIWSMGDGVMLVGRTISHAYDTPGEYEVVANSSIRDPLGETRYAVAKVGVTIIAPDISLEVDGQGRASLYNHGASEANVGGFAIASTGRKLRIPADTLIGAGEEVALSMTLTGRLDREAVLLDAAGVEISRSASPPLVLASDSLVSLPLGWDAERFSEAWRRLSGSNSGSDLSTLTVK